MAKVSSAQLAGSRQKVKAFKGLKESKMSLFKDAKEEPKDKRPKCSIQRGFGNVKWHGTIRNLFDLVKTEPPIDHTGQPINFKPVRHEVTLDYLGEKFIHYVLVLQKLSDCLPRLIHPQKRVLLKKCIETTAARVCELKHQMIQVNKCLYHYFDDLLRDMGLIPDNLEITIPFYMLRDRQQILAMRQHLLAWMIQRIETLKDPKLDDLLYHSYSARDSVVLETKPKPMERTSQIAERHSSKNTASSDELNRYVPDFHCKNVMQRLSRSEKDLSKLLKLQSWCRSWHAKKFIRKLREEEFISLGMSMPTTEFQDDEETDEYDKQENKHDEREEDMIYTKQIEYDRFIESKGLDMAWELKLNLTQWLLEMKDLQGTFPDYPEDAEGGCDAIFREKTVEQLEEELREMFDPKPKKPPKKEAVKKTKPVPEEPGWKMPPSTNIKGLIGLLNEYNSYWYCKFEQENPFQTFDKELVMDEVRSEAGKVIRQQVDKLMRYELETLKLAIENTDYKSKIETKQATSNRVVREKLGPTGDRTVEELYGELVLMGLVKPVNGVRMKDIIGDYNFQQAAQRECIPTISDIKNLVTLLLGLPLSSEFVHKATPMVNTMLFAGPPGTGKSMLLHAICRETGSNLIDLSPSALAGKYEGAEEQNYLKAALLKVGKAMEPTVFYVDECELLFPKIPAPKNEESPSRWTPFFQGLMKKLKQGDRMVLIGMTHLPFYCKTKVMINLFKHVIFFPTPEYGSRTQMWKAILGRLPNLRTTALNISVLSKLTEGYSFREIQFVIDNVLHADRLSRSRPVTNDEFIQCLSLMSRPSVETSLAWLDWYSQVPMVIEYKEWQENIDEMEDFRVKAVM